MSAKTLEILEHCGILNESNRHLVMTYARPPTLELACDCLQKAGILSQESFALVITHSDLQRFMVTLQNLLTTGHLNQDKFEVVVKHPNFDDFAQALVLLYNARLDVLDPASEGFVIHDEFSILAKHPSPISLAAALCELHLHGLLSPLFNQEFLSAHPQPKSFVKLLILLNQRGLLTAEKRELLSGHAQLSQIAVLLTHLSFARRLDPRTFALVTESSEPDMLLKRFSKLDDYDLRNSRKVHQVFYPSIEEIRVEQLEQEIEKLKQGIPLKPSTIVPPGLFCPKRARLERDADPSWPDDVKFAFSSLCAKERELEEVQFILHQRKQQSRNKTEEDNLVTLMNDVFHLGDLVTCFVYPETDVVFDILVQHKAEEKFASLLGPMTDNEFVIRTIFTKFPHQECLEIKFPVEKLESVKEGLRLSARVDLGILVLGRAKC